ncbi:hypothetical protein IAQ61_010415 [Plenodomus lingam]|uniref:Similar to VanZ domain protein n=1 Tax=Leptosphaeria maculans (strain JN3 / isolate v23.1.3 / race Av1-4-5-6-7-8) TaxID=985895 RepID=E5A3X0_LEPMJ|nr:similar to VanZ domain protein [Plenodomus lingam JN3]KAH9862212.1 hypothetical protein IAQ61_010415 [Plenodomus lingam]CBX98315.1 similar to VanZ domain protein [Plenodomus lingam JN3]
MRIRKPFAAAFIGLVFISAAARFSPPDYSIPTYKQSDKVLHFVAFFLLTISFYWILETSRRKVLQLTFTVCTLGLGITGEVVQGLLPINRQFDYNDIVANVAGSLLAIAACNWYHKRMLERKRAARGYTAVAGDEERDIELGESVGGQESGVVRPTVDEELERWDENAVDWETTEPEPVNGMAMSKDDDGDLGDGKKRNN